MKNLQLEKDIYFAKKLVLHTKKYEKYRKYSVVPIRGTENIQELFFKIKNTFQFILMVTASGDQILEAVLYGAKNITCFDVNRLSKYGSKLKVAVIQALEYDEFISFYKGHFSFSLFQKIVPFLEEDSLYFWRQLFNSINCFEIYTSLFDSRFHLSSELTITKCSIYSEKEYYVIKENLKNVTISYIDSNILNIIKNEKIQNQKYNLIYLSNIFYYLRKSERFYSNFVKENIVPLLKENGEVFIHYLYGQGGSKINCTSFSDFMWLDYNQEMLDRFEKLLPITKYYVACTGYGNPVGDKDVVLSLKR